MVNNIFGFLYIFFGGCTVGINLATLHPNLQYEASFMNIMIAVALSLLGSSIIRR